MNKQGLDVLMKKVADGDNEAFARLYDEVKKGVFAFAYSLFALRGGRGGRDRGGIFRRQAQGVSVSVGNGRAGVDIPDRQKFITRRTAKAKTARGASGRGGPSRPFRPGCPRWIF